MRIDKPSTKSIFFRLHILNIYDNPTKINFVKKLSNIFFQCEMIAIVFVLLRAICDTRVCVYHLVKRRAVTI